MLLRPASASELLSFLEWDDRDDVTFDLLRLLLVVDVASPPTPSVDTKSEGSEKQRRCKPSLNSWWVPLVIKMICTCISREPRVLVYTYLLNRQTEEHWWHFLCHQLSFQQDTPQLPWGACGISPPVVPLMWISCSPLMPSSDTQRRQPSAMFSLSLCGQLDWNCISIVHMLYREMNSYLW